ncbi:MAG: hypothetical protein ACE5IZ_08690 [Dehalococcoidia bacterium]
MLDVGSELRLGPVKFDQATVARYLTAVEDEATSRLNSATDEAWVPPLAVAAQFSTAVSQLQLPLEALHTAQELEFLALVPIGSEVTCHIQVVARRQHGDIAFVHLEFESRDVGGTVVVRGKTTVLLPSAEAP